MQALHEQQIQDNDEVQHVDDVKGVELLPNSAFSVLLVNVLVSKLKAE